VPGLFFLSPDKLFCLLAILLLVVATYWSSRVAFGIGAVLAGAVFVPLISSVDKIHQTLNLQLYLPSKISPYLSFEEVATSVNNPTLLISPSQKLISAQGIEALSLAKLNPELQYQDLALLQGKLSVSHRATDKALAKMKDGKPNTRWSPRRGKQLGDEKLFMHFESPISLQALRLDPGKFYTDFPRGIRVSALPTCNLDTPISSSEIAAAQVIFDAPRWLGSIRFTKDGYPYYAHESNVDLVLLKPVTAQCVVIEQIGTDPNFDWSVAEVQAAVVEN
jgi:hypothetical protein